MTLLQTALSVGVKYCIGDCPLWNISGCQESTNKVHKLSYQFIGYTKLKQMQSNKLKINFFVETNILASIRLV